MAASRDSRQSGVGGGKEETGKHDLRRNVKWAHGAGRLLEQVWLLNGVMPIRKENWETNRGYL